MGVPGLEKRRPKKRVSDHRDLGRNVTVAERRRDDEARGNVALRRRRYSLNRISEYSP